MGPRSSVQYQLSGVTDSEMIVEMIKLHEESRQKMLDLFNRYTFKNIKIQTRKVEDISKPNNKLVNDYRGYIVDQVVGYLFGNEVAYTVDKMKYEANEALYDAFVEKLEDFIVSNEMGDLDAETATQLSCAGYAARLYYIDSDNENQTTIMNLPPWEVFFVYDGLKRTHAVRYQYYKTPNKDNALAVTVYSESELIRFIEGGDGKLSMIERKNHGFKRIPVALFQNNAQEMGDFEKVEPLIDAYDVVTSDSVNEVESFAHAYLVIQGYEVDENVSKEAKRTGVLNFPDVGEGASKDTAFFLTKNINDSFLENIKNTLVTNIHKFSGSVDMADEQFSGGAQSGESRKWKMLGLETKAGKKQRKFAKGLREQFRIVCSAWGVEITGISYKDISYKFGRNVPQDLVPLADFASKMNGIISQETLFDNLSGVVDDSKYELDLVRKEREEFAEQLTPPKYDLPDEQ